MVDAQALRAEVISDVVSRLTTGENVRLVGLPLSGRSFVLNGVAERLRSRGSTVIVVQGRRSQRHEQLGALVLSGVDVGRGDIRDRIGFATAWLSRMLQHSGYLLIDDISHLDDATGAVIAAATERHSVPIANSEAPGAALQQSGAWDDLSQRHGAVITLPPLGFDQVHALMESAVPGAMEQNLVARVAVKSGGLPGLVLPMLREARRTGRIRNDNGTWHAAGELITPGLAGPIEALLPTDPDDREAVCLLSLAGPQRFDEARALVGGPTLIRLEQCGLLHPVETSDRPVVSIFPPMLAMFVRRNLPVTLRIEYQERLATVLGETSPPESLLPAPWGTERPLLESPSRMVLPQLIRERLTREIVTLRTVVETDPTPARALEYAMKLDELGVGFGSIHAVLSATTPGSDPRPSAILRTMNAMESALRTGDLRPVSEILSEARPQLRGRDGDLRALEAHCYLMVGQLPAESLLVPAQAEDSQTGHEALRIVEAEVLCARGLTKDALAVLEGLSPASPVLAQVAATTRGIALILEGRHAEALDEASEGFSDAQSGLDINSLVAYAYTAAVALAVAGRTRDLESHLESVLALIHVPSMQRHAYCGILALAVATTAGRGHGEHARSLAQRATVLGPTLGPLPYMWAGAARHLVPPRPGGIESDRGPLLRVDALDALNRGLLPQAHLLAALAAELGHGDGLADQLEAAGEVQSAALQQIVQYLHALDAGNPDQVQEAAGNLSALGFEDLAQRATVMAIRMMRSQGLTSAAAAAALQMWRQLDQRGLDAALFLTAVRTDVDLSAREREVASLLARGMSNQKIAQTLVLSVRTVDNHVLHTYRKVGVDNRDDLAQALATWLAEPDQGDDLGVVTELRHERS